MTLKLSATVSCRCRYQPDIILITFDKFEAIAQKLKDELLRGTIVPSSEDEISRLMYSEASA